jgi:gliding motility-associated-like protein
LDKCGKQLTDTIHVGVIKKPDLEDFDDLSLCIDEEATLSVSNPYGTVVWNNNKTGGSFDILNYEGLLFVKSSNLCGIDSAELNVDIVDCVCDMWFPNVITPNQDGLNDAFGPVDICNKIISYDLTIFNRWGEQVFQSDNVNDLWDGLNAQNNVVSGVYFWIAAWNNIERGQTKARTFSGSLSVIE